MDLHQAVAVMDRRKAPRKTQRSTTAPASVVVAREPDPIAPYERERKVAEAAYYIAERRGFQAGQELDDWLQAEAEIARRG